MDLRNKPVDCLMGRSIKDHLGAWWCVYDRDATHLLVERHGQRGKLRLAMLGRCKLWPTHDEVRQRFPLLLRALRWGGILTEGEAIGAVVGQIVQGNSSMGSEAVSHLGGSAAAIALAWRCRHATRDAWRRATQRVA